MDLLTVFGFALCLALVAVTWAVILVDEGMLLQPVQRWARGAYVKYRINGLLRYIFKDEPIPNEAEFADTLRGLEANPQSYALDLDSQWWWKPLWGCALCVSGQLAFWGFLYYVYYALPSLSWCGYAAAYSPWWHSVCISATLFLTAVLKRIYTWSQ